MISSTLTPIPSTPIASSPAKAIALLVVAFTIAQFVLLMPGLLSRVLTPQSWASRRVNVKERGEQEQIDCRFGDERMVHRQVMWRKVDVDVIIFFDALGEWKMVAFMCFSKSALIPKYSI
eukprot:CCRYP_020396-RA/>CCRYP_020396-RA protein AED:0.47 eAED:0.52 QI:0/1/0/1/0/0/2/0/119